MAISPQQPYWTVSGTDTYGNVVVEQLSSFSSGAYYHYCGQYSLHLSFNPTETSNYDDLAVLEALETGHLVVGVLNGDDYNCKNTKYVDVVFP